MSFLNLEGDEKSGEPAARELGLRLVPENIELNLEGLSQAQIDQIAYESYLVIDAGNNCHTDGIPDGNFDGGLLPGTLDISTPGYLAGGVNLAPFFQIPFPITSRIH